MGQGTSTNTPLNSVPDDRVPIPMPAGRSFIEVAVSPDTRGRALSSPRVPPPPPTPVPLVFKWHGGGDAVFVAGDWDNYASKRPLVRSESGHTLIVPVMPGQHRYHFEVDGKWLTDPERPTTRTLEGNVFNVATAEQVGEFTSTAQQPRASSSMASASPPGDYGQEVRVPPPPADRNKRRGNPNEPPMLPPHLLRALLNTNSPSGNPLLLPLPHHVMLNHLYINRSREHEGISIHGVTCRYRSKYVTTVLYKTV